jgi:antitoxin (DNA-binding transcriptional repressor) of toxin-antitoxin stability system
METIFRSDFRTELGMSDITVQDLKQTLARVLARVGLGEWFTVLRHGKPVARLLPPEEPGVHVGDRFGTAHRIRSAGKRLSRSAFLDVLAEDRREVRE